MRRRAFLGLCGVGLAALLRDGQPAYAQGPGITVGLSGSLFPGLSDGMLEMAAKPFRTLLEDATGVKGAVVQGGSPKELASRLKKDEVQLGVFQGIEYAWARAYNEKLVPVVLCVNQAKRLKGVLIVRASWKGTKVADLKGKSLMLPAETREHCRAFLERDCVAGGLPAKKFYSSIRKAEDVEEAMEEVTDGNVTAAVIDAHAWLSYSKAKPISAKKLRPLATSEEFPPSVVACQFGRFDGGQLTQFRTGLIAAKQTPKGKRLMEFLRMTGFEAAPDDFDQFAAGVARAYPPR
jgi:ABC-type phosphate/phosphonate transport system substrate-binding protein